MSQEIEKKYSNRFNLTYITGIMLGVNAIKGVNLLVDGPDCTFLKGDIIYGNHDLNSELKNTILGNKIFFTGANSKNIIKGHEKLIQEKINILKEDNKPTFFVPMPMTNLLGIQYNNLLDNQFIYLKGSIDKDWIDGYRDLLEGLANYVNLENRKTIKGSVGIVGYLFSRNEGDCLGDIEEIEKILKKIGLKTTSTWLSGNIINNLEEIKNSEYIISLPYGRKAAKIISEKIGAKIIELDYPFGITETNNFIKIIGKETNKGKISNKIIESQTKKINKIILPLIKRYFFGKKVIYGGEIAYIRGIIDLCERLGIDLMHIFGMSNGNKKEEIKLSAKYQKILTLDSEYGKKFKDIDIILKNSMFYSGDEKYIEIGFPSINTHFLNNKCILGYQGIINFIERLINKEWN